MTNIISKHPKLDFGTKGVDDACGEIFVSIKNIFTHRFVYLVFLLKPLRYIYGSMFKKLLPSIKHHIAVIVKN